jgi:DNA-binding transcriptional ArsR family regulator
MALDRIFAALAEPTRRRMIERLARGPASATELGEHLPITLAAVVQHLQVLEESGLIRTEKLGRVRRCRLEPKALDLVDRWFQERRAHFEEGRSVHKNLDRIEELFERALSPPKRPRERGEPKRPKRS